MRSLRSSLQRHFLKLYNIDVIRNPAFLESNTVYENVLKEIKAEGKGDTNHHSEVEAEDMKKLVESFDIHDANGLQDFVWFTNCLRVSKKRSGKH